MGAMEKRPIIYSDRPMTEAECASMFPGAGFDPSSNEVARRWGPIINPNRMYAGIAVTTNMATPQLPHKKGVLTFMDPEYLCPDILDINLIGPADYPRGRVVRAFFRVIDVVWPVRPR